MSEEHVFLACELRATQKVVQLEVHESQIAALREELAQRDSFESLYNAAIDERDDLQQRLADAERRNAAMFDICREIQSDPRLWLMTSSDLAGKINAAINHKPEAASHDE